MKFTIEEKEQGLIIRDYLREVRGLSRRILIAAKSEAGGILVNGSPVTVRYTLQAGDILEITLPAEKVSKWLLPEKMDLSIVYEDEAVIVLDKPAGRATLPSPLHKTGTVANGLLGYYQQIGNPNTIHVVTRLDRETSGLILIAKDRVSHSLLSKKQKQFQIERKYQAIVEGKLREEKGKIHAPIARKPDSIIEREVNPNGKDAVTHYETLKSWATHSLLNIKLETGRTHQIRVHFSHFGCPLAGDDLYGGSKAVMSRHALHCANLTFEHPHTNEILTFQAGMPDDFKQAIEKIEQEV